MKSQNRKATAVPATYRSNTRFRSIRCAVTAALLAFGLLPGVVPVREVSAYQAKALQTEWHYQDDPVLDGPSGSWKSGASGDGYETNGYKYTSPGKPCDFTAEVSATWDMGIRVGRQQLEAFIPNRPGSAKNVTSLATYQIYVDSSRLDTYSIDQYVGAGWTALGEWDTDGGDVEIRLDPKWHCPSAAKLGVDAIRMRCIEQCGPSVAIPTGVVYDQQALRWDRVAGVNTYEVEWKYSSEAQSTRANRTCRTGRCWYQFFPDTSRRFQARVRANSGGIMSDWSEWWVVGAENVVPNIVTGVTLANEILTWKDIPEATAFHIEFERNDGSYRTHYNVGCCVWRLLGSDVRRIRVRATNGIGDGPWSDWTRAAAQIVQPGQVRGLGYNDGQLQWTPLTGATTYDVEWTIGDAASSRSVTCSSSCSLVVPASSSGQTEFRVRGRNSAGVGPWSSWISASTVTDPPGRVTGVKYRDDAIVWDSAPRADSYEIEWRRESGAVSEGSTQTKITCTSTCKFIIDPKDELTFRVRAKNSAGNGPWSQFVTERRQVTPPRRLETPRIVDVIEIKGNAALTWFQKKNPLSNYDGNDVTISWSKVPHARRYRVDYRYRDLSTVNTNSLDLFMESVSDGERTCSGSSRCSGSETVNSSATQYTFESFADTGREKNNLLEFRVTALGDADSRSHPSSWQALRLRELQRELAAQERTGSTLCHKADSVGEFLGYLAVFRAATNGIEKAALAGVNNQLKLIPSLDGVAVEVVKMLNGCYENPVEALAAIPLVGPIVNVTAGPFLGKLHSAYSRLAGVTVGSGDASSEIGLICRIFRESC